MRKTKKEKTLKIVKCTVMQRSCNVMQVLARDPRFGAHASTHRCMKFGSELESRSVLKWRHYNINYNELKGLIKKATSGASQEKRLASLYRGFKENIEYVSLFVANKATELDSRINAAERAIEKFLQLDQGKSSFRDRKVAAFTLELDSLSDQVSDLSRYVMIQKMCLKKLFKKFLKYSEYAAKQDFVDKVISDLVEDVPDSFVNIDIETIFLRLTLLFDVLKGEHTKANFDLEGGTSSYSSFWVHPDNLNELKVLLLKNLDLVCSDVGTKVRQDLKKQKSTLSLKSVKSGLHLSQQDTFLPESRLKVYYLNNLSDPRLTTDSLQLDARLTEGDGTFLTVPVGGFKGSLSVPVTLEEGEMIKCNHLNGLDPKNKAFRWCQTSHTQVVGRVELKQLQFTAPDQCYVSLSSSIQTFDNTKKRAKFPYGFLEIRYNSQMPPALEKLLHSHLVYQVDRLNFNFNNYILIKYFPSAVHDSELVQHFKWLQVLVDKKDFRQLPEREVQSAPSFESELVSKGRQRSQLQKQQRFKYWNEFDDGSDMEEPIWESQPEKPSFFFALFENFFSYWNPQPRSHHYGSIDRDTSAMHDSAVTFLYLTTLLLSCVTLGIVVGVLFSVEKGSHPNWRQLFQDSSPVFALVIVGSYFLSLFLSLFSIALLSLRQRDPPMWHKFVIWLSFTMSTCFMVFAVWFI